MAINLKEKHIELKHDGIESVEFGKGYVIHPTEGKRCTLTFSSHTSLGESGVIKHGAPCTTIEFRFFPCDDIGQGTATELLEAARTDKIATDDPQAVISAIEKDHVLYLESLHGILCITRRDEEAEQFIDNQLYFTSTQREEAITEVVSHMKSCTKRFFGSPLTQKELFSIAAFISQQLP